MLKSKTYLTIITSLILILGLGFILPKQNIFKTQIERFWIKKTFSGRNYNIILMGDSRTYRGVSPQIMHKILVNYKILNFAYSNGGLNNFMFREAEKHLSTKSKNKIIVLGVTPYSLTSLAESNKQYLQELKRPKGDIFQRLYLNPLLTFFSPVKPNFILMILENKKEKHKVIYEQKFYDNGWVASNKIPSNPHEAIPYYKKDFSSIKVSPLLINNLIIQTKNWTEKGIKVFAFRPPTTKEMLLLENKLSGFNEAAFIKQFEKAGGKWLKFNISNYTSYDGSHLSKNSAIKLSKNIALMIKKSITFEKEKINIKN